MASSSPSLGFCELERMTVAVEGFCDVAAAPHHVKVLVDNQGFPADCPGTGVYLRQIKVQVVDSNNNSVTTAFSVQETFSNLTTNTCNTGTPTPDACGAADAGGQFLDSMGVSGDLCGSGVTQGSGCG